jgi:hypothetical protein
LAAVEAAAVLPQIPMAGQVDQVVVVAATLVELMLLVEVLHRGRVHRVELPLDRELPMEAVEAAVLVQAVQAALELAAAMVAPVQHHQSVAPASPMRLAVAVDRQEMAAAHLADLLAAQVVVVMALAMTTAAMEAMPPITEAVVVAPELIPMASAATAAQASSSFAI